MTSLTEKIAVALHARKYGGGWLARCPGHQDRTASLSLSERNGRVLVHCFAGCAQDEVIGALRLRGLWPERAQPRDHRRDHVDEEWRGDLQRVAWWRHGAAALAEELLDILPSVSPERLPLTRLLTDLRSLSDESLISTYREFRRRDSEFTAAMVRAGRVSVARAQRRLARWIMRGMK
jgi:hypothetical protein